MNKLLTLIGIAALVVFAYYIFDENSNRDVGDAFENAADDVGDAVEDVADEVEDIVDGESASVR